MANAARFTGFAGLAGLFGLAAAALASGASVGTLPVFVLVSLSLVVGLATAASP